MKRLPIVALIGQTNAGKSSLLNRLARKNLAIVAREEGTTRDNVVATIDDAFILIDTAGLKDPDDDFEASIQNQIADAIDSADLILLTLDSSKYPDHRDKQIAKSALRSKKPVYLLLNKSDLGESLPLEEFRSLGISPDHTLHTSATTGAGTRELKATIMARLRNIGMDAVAKGSLPTRPSVPSPRADGAASRAAALRTPTKNLSSPTSKPPLKLALIGRPNVGKSSLFNSLGQKQQAIVSSRQGTTRDINRVQINYHKHPIEILDTAGLRRPGKREVGIEKFSAIRTLATIEEADICALLIDATEPHAKLDQALAGQIVKAGKGIIVVITKMDLLKTDEAESGESFSSPFPPASEQTSIPHSGMTSARETGGSKKTSPNSAVSSDSATHNLLDNLERDFDFLPYAPVLLTSSKTGKNITKLFDLLLEVDAARHTETQTAILNKILREAIVSHPPAGLKNTHPKPKYIVQTDTCPPWFVIHGREMELMHWSYKRYLERKIREVYPMTGTPIAFSFHNERPRKRSRH